MTATRLFTALFLSALPAFGAGPLAVAVTIAPQAWLVEQIGGDRVAVTTLVGPGESPATFLPSDRQVSLLSRSAVYFRIGVPGERGPWFDTLRRSGRVEIVDLRDGVELLALPRHHHDHDHDHHHAATGAESEPHAAMDPHIWLSPRRLQRMARTVAETLERLDGESGGHYRQRLGALEARLDRLEAELRDKLAPLADRAFMIFHPVLGYLASDYGLRQLAIEIEGKEPSDAELTELMRIARREALSVVFVQPQIRGRSAEIVARAIGGRVAVLDPLAPDVAANLNAVADQIADTMAPRGQP